MKSTFPINWQSVIEEAHNKARPPLKCVVHDPWKQRIHLLLKDMFLKAATKEVEFRDKHPNAHKLLTEKQRYTIFYSPSENE